MQTQRVTAGDILRHVLIFAVITLFMFPIYWTITTSLKASEDILTRPPKFLFDPTFENYRYAFREANFGHYIRNTLVVALISTAIAIVLGAMASYSFARYNVGGGHLMFFILTTRMMPAIAIIIPYFIIFRNLGRTAIGSALGLGLDQLGALVVSYTMFNLPFAIWLMFSFFQDIPPELESSARLDGYTRLQTLRKVVLPLAAPGIAVTAILCLLFTWNEFLFAFLLTRERAATITVGVAGFWTQQGILWGPMAAAAVICVLPMMIFVLFLQRYIVRGLTFGAVRG